MYMNNVPFYEKCFRMKVLDQKEIHIACCGNSLLFVRRFGVQFMQGLCRTSTDQNVILPTNLVRIANTEFHSNQFNSLGGEPCR